MSIITNMLKSKTLWGLIISALGKFLETKGIEVSHEQQERIITEAFNLGPQLMEWGGIIFAAYGRITAKDNLTGGGLTKPC